MIARLGQVVYWACDAIAVCIVGLMAYSHVYVRPLDQDGALFFGAVALVIFLFGRACLYILAGR